MIRWLLAEANVALPLVKAWYRGVDVEAIARGIPRVESVVTDMLPLIDAAKGPADKVIDIVQVWL
jgi:hypothetical protein